MLPPPLDFNLPAGKKSKKPAIRHGQGVSAGFDMMEIGQKTRVIF